MLRMLGFTLSLTLLPILAHADESRRVEPLPAAECQAFARLVSKATGVPVTVGPPREVSRDDVSANITGSACTLTGEKLGPGINFIAAVTAIRKARPDWRDISYAGGPDGDVELLTNGPQLWRFAMGNDSPACDKLDDLDKIDACTRKLSKQNGIKQTVEALGFRYLDGKPYKSNFDH